MALWKVLRWVVLIVLLFAIFAAMRRPSPIAAEAPPEAVQANSAAFDAKLQQLSDAHERGQSSEARFTAEEVNAVITRTMQETEQTPAPTPASQSEQASTETEGATPGTPGGAPVRTVQVAFQGSEVTGQFATEIHGKEVYITLSGRLGSKDGYVTFEPTSFKLGNLVVPVSWMSETFQQKLAEPENREKLRLPDFIASLRVENGELVITER